MKKILSTITAIFLATLFHTAALADENTTLQVTLLNHTADALQFDHVANTKPGDVFTVTPSTVQPGETCLITAETNLGNDIFGHVVFTNKTGEEIPVVLLDQVQIHYGRPIFSVSTPHYTSLILTKTRNKNIGPHYLTYLSAAIKVFER